MKGRSILTNSILLSKPGLELSLYSIISGDCLGVEFMASAITEFACAIAVLLLSR